MDQQATSGTSGNLKHTLTNEHEAIKKLKKNYQENRESQQKPEGSQHKKPIAAYKTSHAHIDQGA